MPFSPQLRRLPCLALLAASACHRTVPVQSLATPATLATRVTTLADSTFATLVDVDPEFATRSGIATGPHDRLPDNTPAGIAATQARWDRLRSAVQAIDPTPLAGHPEFALYGIMREQLDAEQQLRVCRHELWTVASYVNGWQARFTDLALIQPTGTELARAQALARARAIAPWLAQEEANLREGLRKGYRAPTVIVRNVISQVDGLIATPPRKSPLFAPATRDTTPAFVSALAQVVAGEIATAMQRYRDFLANEYLGQAREALGVSNNPDGAACYAATLRSFATIAIDPDTVLARGLREMARIEDEMRAILVRSFGGESLATLLPRLRTDPRYTYRTSQEIIDSSQAIIDRGKREMGKWFGRLPRASLAIQPYPEFRQRAGAPGQYQAAPDDGSRPAIFRINPSDPTHRPRAGPTSTAVHEAIPGHHLQVALAKEQGAAHPLSRYSFNSGFGEGWALYAERLADEMGLFSSDLDRLGMLGSEAFRAARMVIDASVHTKGWTREQAYEYLTTHTFVLGNKADGEIDRYISWPGQAPSYMIGRNEILALRAEAKQAMGDRFDIRAFHDTVLGDGSVPLAFLRQRVERWMHVTR